MLSIKQKEKILLDGLKLKPGDRIKFIDGNSFLRNNVFIIRELNNFYHLIDKDGGIVLISELLNQHFEKVSSKKFGELNCHDIKCNDCPLHCINCCSVGTLYHILEATRKKYNMSEGVYDVLLRQLNDETEL